LTFFRLLNGFMGEPHNTESDDGNQPPALLGRIRRVACFVFGVFALVAIVSIAWQGLAIVWQLMRGH
jgi:hypothetical protein